MLGYLLDPTWLHNHLDTVLVIGLPLYNLALSTTAKVFQILQKTAPPWLATAAAWGLKVTQWLSANTPTPPPVDPKK